MRRRPFSRHVRLGPLYAGVSGGYACTRLDVKLGRLTVHVQWWRRPHR